MGKILLEKNVSISNLDFTVLKQYFEDDELGMKIYEKLIKNKSVQFEIIKTNEKDISDLNRRLIKSFIIGTIMIIIVIALCITIGLSSRHFIANFFIHNFDIYFIPLFIGIMMIGYLLCRKIY